MINRQSFFNTIRPLFMGSLDAHQVEGMEAIMNEWEARELTDKRQLAYVLGTVYHETGRKMQPTREMGGEKYLKSKPYYPYFGRDLCQTTWRGNYQKVKDFTGIDVVNHPDLIADLNVSAKTAIEFMLKGYYTGKKLSDYFNETKCDWKNARRIINGTDAADKVATNAKSFFAAIG